MASQVVTFRLLLLAGSLFGVGACGAPLRQVPLALDPSSPDAPESALPRRVAPIELPPLEPDKLAPPQTPAAPPEQLPAGHHMHHMHPMPDPPPKSPPPAGVKDKPMDHSLHGGMGGGR